MSLNDNPTERVVPVDHVTGERDPGGQEPRRFGRLIVGVLGGLAIGLLLATGAQQNSSDTETAPLTIPEVAAPPTVPTTTTTLAPSRLDILVDGYNGTLYLAGLMNSQAQLWRWESRSGTPVPLGLPEDTFWATFNSSETRLGVLTRRTLSPGAVLWVGPRGNPEPLAVDVADFIWHALDPDQIAWIENLPTGDAASSELHTANLPAVSDTSVLLEQGGRLVGYDDGLVLLDVIDFDEEEFVRAIDLEGLEVGRLQGRFLGTLPNGRILISQASALVTTLFDLSDPQTMESPDSQPIYAILSSRGVTDLWAMWEIGTPGVEEPTRLWILRNEEIVFETAVPSELSAVSWSHDGRWLVTSVGSGASSGDLWFIDTTDWSMHQVAAPGFVSSIAAVP